MHFLSARSFLSHTYISCSIYGRPELWKGVEFRFGQFIKIDTFRWLGQIRGYQNSFYRVVHLNWKF